MSRTRTAARARRRRYVYISLAVLLLLFARQALCLPTDACTEAAWTIKDMNIKYGLEVRQGGSTTFTLVNNLTGKSEALSCALRANSRCKFDGISSDGGLTLDVQIETGVLYLTLTDRLSCGGTTTYANPPNRREAELIATKSGVIVP